MKHRALLSSPWLLMASALLALTWLLPNHYPPWTAFHMEAGAAMAMMPVALWIGWSSPYRTHWKLLNWACAIALLLPLVQWLAGEVSHFGTAWICSAYIMGFLLAINTGQRWELATPGQCADYLFMAIGAAAVASALLQFYQLSGEEFLGKWVLTVPQRLRLYANVGQPNQLASLQMLGLLGVSWGVVRGYLGNVPATILAAILLFGVALTGSRTAYINLLLLVLVAYAYRGRGVAPRFSWAVAALALHFVLCVVLLPSLYGALGVLADTDALRQRSHLYDIRLQIWSLALQASMLRPLFGFGWGQIPEANFMMAEHASDGLGMFNASHNLFIDLVLWNGYPIGLLLSALILCWLVRVFRNVTTLEQMHYLLAVIMLSVHALFELPLQYAYFLLPFGMFAGALDVGLKRPVCAQRYHRILAVVSVLGIAAVLCVTVVDYLKIETRNYGLRFEANGIPTSISSTAPEVRVLNQFNEFFALVRNQPSPGLNDVEIDGMRDSVNIAPSAQTMFNLAANLALNGKPQESRHWLVTLCKTMVDVNCQEARQRWEYDAYPARTGVSWPLKIGDTGLQ